MTPALSPVRNLWRVFDTARSALPLQPPLGRPSSSTCILFPQSQCGIGLRAAECGQDYPNNGGLQESGRVCLASSSPAATEQERLDPDAELRLQHFLRGFLRWFVAGWAKRRVLRHDNHVPMQVSISFVSCGLIQRCVGEQSSGRSRTADSIFVIIWANIISLPGTITVGFALIFGQVKINAYGTDDDHHASVFSVAPSYMLES